ncbi:hypothetical protein [Ammoniphilus resinae]|uniref:Uncharacterized protein n=1 Tax=Ammoniphilus resinae TaxID=861532 RepID=A0ABS4GX79_9BACL|nr:hypothetical protein [Ammoniphilus resinae]MBP1934869.1 hypothetical protein [Ammoniphilus resinae]
MTDENNGNSQNENLNWKIALNNPMKKAIADQHKWNAMLQPNPLSKAIERQNQIARLINPPEDRENESLIQKLKKLDEAKQEKIRKDEEYKQSVLSALQGIEKNTANLSDMVLLLQKNEEKQEEVFKLLVQILEIAKSPNKKEAESKYRKVMTEIGKFRGDIETAAQLFNFAKTTWDAITKILGN